VASCGLNVLCCVQVVDDILDFTSTAEQLGKPRYQDIVSGNLTAPALLAMRKCPELVDIIETEFMEDGSLERAVHLIEQNGGAARHLARAGAYATTIRSYGLSTTRACVKLKIEHSTVDCLHTIHMFCMNLQMSSSRVSAAAAFRLRGCEGAGAQRGAAGARTARGPAAVRRAHVARGHDRVRAQAHLLMDHDRVESTAGWHGMHCTADACSSLARGTLRSCRFAWGRPRRRAGRVEAGGACGCLDAPFAGAEHAFVVPPPDPCSECLTKNGYT
jgi:Polyprenyl synthetase